MRASTTPVNSCTRVRARAVAKPGLLARLAVVLNAHPVSTFHYTEQSDGTATLTVGLTSDAAGRDEWHLKRVVARLNRVVGVLSVEPPDVH